MYPIWIYYKVYAKWNIHEYTLVGPRRSRWDYWDDNWDDCGKSLEYLSILGISSIGSTMKRPRYVICTVHPASRGLGSLGMVFWERPYDLTPVPSSTKHLPPEYPDQLRWNSGALANRIFSLGYLESGIKRSLQSGMSHRHTLHLHPYIYILYNWNGIEPIWIVIT